jgi:hypothetical protein
VEHVNKIVVWKKLIIVSLFSLTLVLLIGRVCGWYFFTLEKCNKMVDSFDMHYIDYRELMYAGCENVIDRGLKENNVEAIRFGGKYYLNIWANEKKSEALFKRAVELGDEKSKIYLLEMLHGGAEGRNCKYLSALISSYKPSNAKEAKDKIEWTEEVKNLDC